jgi:hypothetical protein
MDGSAIGLFVCVDIRFLKYFWYLGRTMGRRKEEPIHITPRLRAALALVGLLIMAPGLLALAQAKLHYRDERGLLAFAPFTLLIGFVMIVFAIRIGRRR